MLTDMAIKKGSGFIPWNKGLTKETSKKIKEWSEWKSSWWKNLKENDPIAYKKLCAETGGKSKGKAGLKMEKSPVWKGGK